MRIHSSSSTRWSIRDFRGHVLKRLFSALYTRFVFLHEPAGRFLFGKAWPARRRYVLHGLDDEETLLDLGCGEGRLLALAVDSARSVHGLEPSPAMRRRARKRNLQVLAGCAQKVPMPAESVDVIVATYPGPWILDPPTWSEMRRLLAPSGRISILVGGTYTRGPLTKPRSWLHRLAYGRASRRPPGPIQNLKQLGESAGVCLSTRVVHDAWGEAYVINGVAADRPNA